LVELLYNTNSHSATQISPYEVLYNQPLPLHLPYLPGESANAKVDRAMSRREEMIRTLKQHLAKAQQRMKMLADQCMTDKIF